MTLSGKYADASAAIIESAQTGHVGRSLPRGAECSRAVDRISAIAGIRDLLLKNNQSGLSGRVHASFDDVATQMRFFYEFQSARNRFLAQRVIAARRLAPTRWLIVRMSIVQPVTQGR
jgi:hypothetical protein